ncbi:alpha/beta hydrolase [Devosia sp. FKR38]|uniref:alpha/beta hydrolase n=1 Tax=Devosia sp. FKR38 TaxID=2562312 RepID=UPI0010C0EB60|nr:alpha/beta hydrolase [Devosia sp. FKR38]
MKLLRRILLALGLLLVVAYGGALAYMYVNQRALQYDAEGPITPLADSGLTAAQAVAIASGDGVINGWYQAPQPGKPLIVFYKGNSGSFSKEHERYVQFVADGYGFLAFDYRGFPMSPGSISQEHILEDAINAFDWAAEKGAPIVIWGRSLGSGPATYVASQREARALLLETPFLSAVTVAAERYPFLPVGLVMQDQFPSNVWMADVSEPVMVAHGTADKTIDVSNGERLYGLAPHPDNLWIEPGAGHSDMWARGIWARAEPFFERAMTAS